MRDGNSLLKFLLESVFIVSCGLVICFVNEGYKKKSSNFTYDTVELASISLDSQLEGEYHGGSRFRYGYGYINEQMYYVVYEVLSDGGLYLSKLDAEKTIIYETLPEGETAYVEVKRNGFGRIVENKLYVPDGSICREYDLSLSGL